MMVTKKLLAEFIGTFALTFVLLLASNTENFPIPIPVLAGITLSLFVYTIGAISGCHINPAVTLGLASIKKIEMPEALRYIAAQTLGALLALMVTMTLDIGVTGLDGMNQTRVLTGEIIGTAFFTFGLAAAVLGKMAGEARGLVIGMSIFLGATIAGMVGAPGFLNPAVALGAKSLTLTTLFGPIIGSVIGIQLYKFLVAKN